MRVSTYCVTSWFPLQVTRMPGYFGPRLAVSCFGLVSALATVDIELISEIEQCCFPHKSGCEHQFGSSFRILAFEGKTRIEKEPRPNGQRRTETEWYCNKLLS